MQRAQQMFWGSVRRKWWLLTVATWTLLLVIEPGQAAAADLLEQASNESTRLTLKTRKRVETSKGSGDYRTVAETQEVAKFTEGATISGTKVGQLAVRA